MRTDPEGDESLRSAVEAWSELPASYTDNSCKNRPDTTRECWRTHGCDHNWVAADWTACDATCGQKGKQTRNVVCQAKPAEVRQASSRAPAGATEDTSQVKYVDDALCDSPTDTKPIAARECDNDDLLCTYRWSAQEWEACPDGCGSSFEVRPVVCVREDGTLVSDERCRRNAGVHKRALEFDDNGYVLVNNFPSIKTPTYEFWMKADGLRAREETLLHKDKHIAVKWAAGKLAFWVHTAGLGWAIAASYSLDAEDTRFTWTHVAATFDGKQANLFVDGDRVASVAFSAVIDQSPSPLVIGGTAEGESQFNGLLSGVRVWEAVRSGLEIKGSYDETLKGTEQGLVALWPLDEVAGSTVAHDAVVGGNTYDGALLGGGLRWVDNMDCEVELNTAFAATAPLGRPLVASSFEGCANLCASTDGCVAWTFIPAGAPEAPRSQYRECSLVAAGDYESNVAGGSVSGLKAACRVDNGKPNVSRRCESRKTCVYGRATPMPWSDPALRCSATCGAGVRRRESRCQIETHGSMFYGQEAGAAFCAALADKSYVELECEDDSSCAFEWVAGDWQDNRCAAACGESSMPRAVSCQKRTKAGDPTTAVGSVPSARCDADAKLPATKTCYSVATCEYSWGSEDWGDCAPACGTSTQKRRVWCLRSDNQQVEAADCAESAGEKPDEAKACYSYDTCTYAWHYKGAGSASCGDGIKNGDETEVDCGGSCPDCSVDGGWSAYGPWGACDATCGEGVMLSTRTCTSPAPANGGRPCDGAASISKVCKLPACQVDFGDVCDYTSALKSYDVSIKQGETLTLTTIPPGKAHVAIKLTANVDVDIRLETEMGDPLVSYTDPNEHWGTSLFEYRGMKIKGCTDGCASPQQMLFHGDGKTHTFVGDADYSSEYIYVVETDQPLVLKASGYQDGHGTVSYQFDCVSDCSICTPLF